MDEEYVEKEPLFPSPQSSVFEGEETSTPPTLDPPRRRKGHNLITNVFMIAYIPLLVLYALLAHQYIRSKPFGQTVDLNLFPCALSAMRVLSAVRLMLKALARSWPVQTEKKFYKLRVVDSNFTGKPEPVIDQAWHDLLEGSTSSLIKITLPRLTTSFQESHSVCPKKILTSTMSHLFLLQMAPVTLPRRS